MITSHRNIHWALPANCIDRVKVNAHHVNYWRFSIMQKEKVAKTNGDIFTYVIDDWDYTYGMCLITQIHSHAYIIKSSRSLPWTHNNLIVSLGFFIYLFISYMRFSAPLPAYKKKPQKLGQHATIYTGPLFTRCNLQYLLYFSCVRSLLVDFCMQLLSPLAVCIAYTLWFRIYCSI